MESKASHRHQKNSKHTSSAPICSSSVQDSSSESAVLPADLITEILLKLPVKSLVRFKCVSKSWLDLTSSPEFVKTHLSISANNTCHRLMLEFGPPESNLKECSVSSLLYDHVTREIDMDYPPKKSHQSIQVVGSVNGLICVAIEEKDLFIWNPSIRNLKKLPSSRTGCFCMYGFGYDELHDDYKVVGITENVRDDRSHYNVGKVYSLNNSSWNRLDDFQIVIQSHKSGMFVNGKLHWTTSKTFVYYNDNWNIIAVNLADGRWGEMEKPYYGEGNLDFLPQLGMLGNNLSMCCQHLSTHADVWVMKEYGVKESWTKMFFIKYPNALMRYSLFSPPFCMSSEGEILFKNGPVFVIYNPNDDSIRYTEVTNCRHLVEATLYIESLVWPFVAKHTRNASTFKAAKALMKTILLTNK